jgi:peptidyl-prolyl cis-trans isomerase C
VVDVNGAADAPLVSRRPDRKAVIGSEQDNSMTMSRLMFRARQLCLGAFAFAAASGLAGPGSAQEPAPDAVVATVNGDPITNADLALTAAEFGDQLSQVPAERRQSALIDLLINIRLASKAAEAEGIESDPAVVRRLDLARDRTLYSEYLRKKFIAVVTEDAVRQRFGKELADFVPADEIRARHILVKTEDEAKAIIAELDAGGDFAAIATEKSQDPGSAKAGGDLGFFKRGAMVKPFEDAAFSLKPGEYTKTPVQSDFGWHVILVEEQRKEPPPTFESQSQRIQQEMIRETFDAQIEALRSAAKIEIVPPANGG